VVFLIERISTRNRLKKLSNNENFYPSCSHYSTEKRECDYCEKLFEESENYSSKPWYLKEAEIFWWINNHLSECKGAKRVVDKLKRLGKSIDLLKLKDKKRIGVIKSLKTVGMNGIVDDLMVFLEPYFTSFNYEVISDYLLKEKEDDFFCSVHGSRRTNRHERAVVIFFIWRMLQKKNKWNYYNVYVLETSKNGLTNKISPLMGNSLSLAIYLSLLSAYHQIPISQEVSATGCVDIADTFCLCCLRERMIKDLKKKSLPKHRISRVDNLEIKFRLRWKRGLKS